MARRKKTIPVEKPIFLVGFMGVGKSTIGEILAERLGVAFIDTDVLIEEREGQSVSAIFRKQGEEYFRQVEREVIKQVSSLKTVVVATGGGVVMNGKSLDLMKDKGLVIYLEASPIEIMQRVQVERRPLLSKVNDPLSSIERLLQVRRPYYEQAHLKVSIDGETPGEVVKEIINQLKSYTAEK